MYCSVKDLVGLEIMGFFESIFEKFCRPLQTVRRLKKAPWPTLESANYVQPRPLATLYSNLYPHSGQIWAEAGLFGVKAPAS